MVRQVRPASLDSGVEGPPAGRRSLGSSGQDRVSRRQRLAAFGHRRDAARSEHAGGRGACAAHRADPLRRHSGAARLGAGAELVAGAVVSLALAAILPFVPFTGLRSSALAPPVSWPISAGTRSRGTGSSSTRSFPSSHPASSFWRAPASFTARSASRSARSARRSGDMSRPRSSPGSPSIRSSSNSAGASAS